MSSQLHVLAVVDLVGVPVQRGQAEVAGRHAGQQERRGAGGQPGRAQRRQQGGREGRDQEDELRRRFRKDKARSEGRQRDMPGAPRQ
jgi:hypothetical protein